MDKKILSGLVCATMVVGALTACGGSTSSAPAASGSTSTSSAPSAATSASGDAVHLTLAHADTEEGSLFGNCMMAFKEMVEEKSKGSIVVDIYPNGQLGTVPEYVTGVQNGTIDLAPAASTFVANFCTNVAVFDMPFLFEDYDHVWETLDGEVGDMLTKDLKDNGIIALDWWGLGFRNVTTSDKHPIESIDDFKGFRIRTMQSAIHQEIFQTLGADAVPMDWGELFTALQQGTVDGEENPFTQVFSSSIYEVNPIIVKTEHAFTPSVFMMSPAAESKMSEEQLKTLYDCADECAKVFREETVSINEEALQNLLDKNCKFVETIDKADLQAATEGIYAKHPEYSEMVDIIKGLRK